MLDSHDESGIAGALQHERRRHHILMRLGTHLCLVALLVCTCAAVKMEDFKVSLSDSVT